MNIFDDSWLSDIEQIVVPFEVFPPILEALTAKSCLTQPPLLDHCPHGSIKNHNALLEQRL